jgi:hypothetical protein
VRGKKRGDERKLNHQKAVLARDGVSVKETLVATHERCNRRHKVGRSSMLKKQRAPHKLSKVKEGGTE